MSAVIWKHYPDAEVLHIVKARYPKITYDANIEARILAAEKQHTLRKVLRNPGLWLEAPNDPAPKNSDSRQIVAMRRLHTEPTDKNANAANATNSQNNGSKELDEAVNTSYEPLFALSSVSSSSTASNVIIVDEGNFQIPAIRNSTSDFVL